MINKGKIVREVIDGYGIKHIFIADKLGIDKDVFGRLLNAPNLPVEDIERIGEVIRHDFRKQFPDLIVTIPVTDPQPIPVAEPQADYTPKQFSVIMQQFIELHKKLDDLKNPKQQ